jgi:flagella basal body P-ring formation protein FlgA
MTYQVQTLGRADYLGSVSLLVTFFVDGMQKRSVRLSGKVDVMQEVVVAKEDLQRRQKINREAVTLRQVNLARISAKALTEESEVVGMQTARTIKAGEVILPHMLKKVPLVKRGDHLILVAESASLKVVATAKALEDGFEGEQVRVANASSGKEVRGRVLGPRSVKVDF